jgi:hypothetical protein
VVLGGAVGPLDRAISRSLSVGNTSYLVARKYRGARHNKVYGTDKIEVSLTTILMAIGKRLLGMMKFNRLHVGQSALAVIKSQSSIFVT